jgi:plasmid stabilization system protein ParE
MPSYELSIEAAADLESIGDFGVTRFGLAQALKYQLALESRFELLAQFPRMGAPTFMPAPTSSGTLTTCKIEPGNILKNLMDFRFP